MTQPLVTVIVPAYNHERWINRCLVSIFDQTYDSLQILVIDDGSTDGSRAEIEKTIAECSTRHVDFFSKKNEGLCATLNLGISRAKGKYVEIIASDDEWLPDKTSAQVAFLEHHEDIGLVFSDAIFLNFDRQLDRTWSSYKPVLRKIFKNGQAKGDVSEKVLIDTFIPALTVMMRKSVLDAVGPYDSRLPYEDDDMWYRISRISSIGYIDKALAKYRIHGSNISSNSIFMLRGYFATIRKHISSPPPEQETPEGFFPGRPRGDKPREKQSEETRL